MFYVKTNLTDECSVKVEITDENVFTACPICERERQADLTELASEGDFDLYDLDLFCEECGNEIQKYIDREHEDDSGEFNYFKILTEAPYPSNLFAWALRHSPSAILDAASDAFMAMTPGYHNDLPLGDINVEYVRRAREVIAQAERTPEL